MKFLVERFLRGPLVKAQISSSGIYSQVVSLYVLFWTDRIFTAKI